MQYKRLTKTWRKEAKVRALLGTDQISSADERSSVIIKPSNDGLTEVRSKSAAVMATVNKQDEI